MDGTATRQVDSAQIRAVYEQLDLADGRVARIADPENGYAWIQSDVAMPVRA